MSTTNKYSLVQQAGSVKELGVDRKYHRVKKIGLRALTGVDGLGGFVSSSTTTA